ncbi:MAG: 2-C-methyl-D-erythritol 4-phosphate cytidylyltransferase [Clostridia bacterium]|nr:2-C-methyl-D-erythritol 4-phosphate cytidylyltransferase [Clostridia bacterium]
MQRLKFGLEFFTTEEKTGVMPVVIVAAGSSSRMAGVDKQMLELCGVPVIVRTLRAFENCPLISEITVVTREDRVADINKMAQQYAVSKLKNVIVGGSCRAESVKKGVELYLGVFDKVLVHDGARPLVTNEVITAVAEALNEYNSVTCAVKINDTVKRINDDNVATETLNREGLVSVQTPQGVDVMLFLKALENADMNIFTDDTSVMEYIGEKTKIVDGNPDNIKITTPEDIKKAEGIIRKEW